MTRRFTGAGAVLAFGGLALLLWLERRRPLRRSVEPGPGRLVRNMAVGALTAAAVSAIERPIVNAVSTLCGERRWGIAARAPLPLALRTALAVLLMDYTLYWWHVVLHRVPALWRLHEPHHLDLDLDTSTGVRFHALEFVASIPWRCAQIALIGVDPRTLALWQRLTLAEVLLHHSNARLPRVLERWLGAVLVTPRMHGLHHSVERSERDSNFSSGLSVWDRIHGTACSSHNGDVTIGLPDFRQLSDVTLAKTLGMPFRRSAVAQAAPPSTAHTSGEAWPSRVY